LLYRESVLTVGVDLAAEPAKSAIAWLDWSPTGALVGDLLLAAQDDTVATVIRQADKAGIDAPFGWPQKFVAFVSAHEAGNVIVPEEVAGREWRRQLAYRLTDEAVREATGLIPSSVAADRIAHTAMRCAGLLARLASNGRPVDRCGTGVVVEVHPAASLQQWELPYRGYKGAHNIATLAELVDALQAAAPWLALGRYEDVCRRSDGALDAVVAALTARAAARGLVTRPGPDDAAVAKREGWIALPTCALADLAR
jgi:predicted nuclease with RNAse H fold